MFGLTSLEVYTSFLIEQIRLYADNLDEFLYAELKDLLEEILSISETTHKHLWQETIGPRIVQASKKVRSEKSSTDGYLIQLLNFVRSPFRDFESYLRIVVGLD